MATLETAKPNDKVGENSRFANLKRNKMLGIVAAIVIMSISAISIIVARQYDNNFAAVFRFFQADFTVFADNKDLREIKDTVTGLAAEQARIASGKHPYQDGKPNLASFIYDGNNILISKNFLTIKDYGDECDPVEVKDSDNPVCSSPKTELDRDEFLDKFAELYGDENIRLATVQETAGVFSDSTFFSSKLVGELTNTKVNVEDDDYFALMVNEKEESNFETIPIDDDDGEKWLTARAVIIIPEMAE